MAEPPACPSCKKPLDKVDYTAYDTYVWDREKGTFVEDVGNPGTCDIKCPNCGADVGDLPGMEDGPLNYTASAPEAEAK